MLVHTASGKDIQTPTYFCWDGWNSATAGKGFIPFLQLHRRSVRGAYSSPPKESKAQKEEDNASPVKAGEQKLGDLARVGGSSLALCHATLSDQGFQSNAWVPDLFWNPQLPALRLPPLSPKRGQCSPPCSLGCETEFPPVWQIIGDQTSLLAGGSSSTSLPEIPALVWDQHAGSDVFPLASERSGRQYIESLNIPITRRGSLTRIH